MAGFEVITDGRISGDRRGKEGKRKAKTVHGDLPGQGSDKALWGMFETDGDYPMPRRNPRYARKGTVNLDVDHMDVIVQAMPDKKHEQIFVLRLQGQSLQEIAQLTDTPLPTVQKVLERGVRAAK